MKKRYLVYFVALLLTGCRDASVGERQKEYAVLVVGLSDVETIDKYPTLITGRQDVEIYPQVTGKITDVCVTEGEHVRKGQTLFVIDQVPYTAALQTAEANFNAAKATVATARLDYEGKKKLHDNGVASLFEVQKAENALLSAEAAMEQAQAQVTTARNDLSYTIISSPCDGVVGTLPYRAGTLVSPTLSSPMTTVSDNSEMYVYFSIPENRMISLIRQYGSPDSVLAAMPEVCLFLNDGSEYGQKGRVESISGVLDAQTGSVSLRAVFLNERGLLQSGGAGNVGLVEQKKGVITIPQSSTYELQDKVYAYRVVAGTAVATQVKVRELDAQKAYIVSSGLNVGDTIVAEGVAMLQDGHPITIKKEGGE